MPTITRIFVSAGAIATAVSLQAPRTSAQTLKNAKPTIVLVHGAFADGSSWQRVIPILQRDGYTVIAVPYGLCRRSAGGGDARLCRDPEADHRQRVRRHRGPGGMENDPVVVPRVTGRQSHQSRPRAVLREAHGSEIDRGQVESRAVSLTPGGGGAIDRAGGGAMNQGRRSFLATAARKPTTIAAAVVDVDGY